MRSLQFKLFYSLSYCCCFFISFLTTCESTSIDLILQSVYNKEVDMFGSLERTEVAHLVIEEVYKQYPGLETECSMKDCVFRDVNKHITEAHEVTQFLAILACTKLGISCDRDGYWEKWQEWSLCPMLCGYSDTRVRYRTCVSPQTWGRECGDVHSQVEACKTNSSLCHHSYTNALGLRWGDWSAWSACNQTCGQNSVMSRSRTCYSGSTQVTTCLGGSLQEKRCHQLPPCPVNGGWTQVAEAQSAAADSTNGGSCKVEKRTCTNPRRSGTGINCVGEMIRITGSDCDDGRKLVMGNFNHQSFMSFTVHSTGVTNDFITFTIQFKMWSFGGAIVSFYTAGDEDYFQLNVQDDGRLMFLMNFNNCTPIAIPTDKIMLGEWMVMRVDVIGAHVTIRLNDGVSVSDHVNDINRPNEKCSSTPLRGSGGVFRLGQWKQHIGFKGLLLSLHVNFVPVKLQRAVNNGQLQVALPSPLPNAEWIFGDVVELDQVDAVDSGLYENSDAGLIFFDGSTRMKISFELKGALPSLEVIMKPYQLNCVILWNRAVRNRATQSKLLLENGNKFRFLLIVNGKIYSLRTKEGSASMYEWNKVRLEWPNPQLVRMRVNNDAWVEMKIPPMTGRNIWPHTHWLIGGLDKGGIGGRNERSVEASEKFDKFNYEIVDFIPPFRGYISSVKQNDVEYLPLLQTATNLRESLSSLSSSSPDKFSLRRFSCNMTGESPEMYDSDEDRKLVCEHKIKQKTHASIVWYKNGEIISRKFSLFPSSNNKIRTFQTKMDNVELKMDKDGSITFSLLVSVEKYVVDDVTGIYTCALVGDRKPHIIVISYVVSCQYPNMESVDDWYISLAIFAAVLLVLMVLQYIVFGMWARHNEESSADTDVLELEMRKGKGDKMKIDDIHPWYDVGDAVDIF